MPRHDLEAIKSAFSNGNGLVTRQPPKMPRGWVMARWRLRPSSKRSPRDISTKSMTSIYDASVWQDVYHVPHAGGTLYVKFTDNGGSEFTLLSFKEK